MYLNRLILIFAAAFVPTVSIQQGSASEGLGGRVCVPDGASVPVSFPRPDLQQPGVPTDAKWAPGDGNPQGYEKDRFTGDDPMPTTPGSGDPAEVPVENEGGKLKDGNGKTQNGGTEGDCIEVYVEWTYYYSVKWNQGGTVSIGGATWSKNSCWYVWKAGKIRSAVKQVCPC
ncbi:MAG: hypothetical protein O3A20_00065 [Planctomycetota bacterium]|nr:hypothetical protein [Planctomycetota bacterium]